MPEIDMAWWDYPGHVRPGTLAKDGDTLGPLQNNRKREIAKHEQIIQEWKADHMRMCAGLRHLVLHGYLKHLPSFVGEGAEAHVVHTVGLAGRCGADDFLVNYCPICGSAFTPRDGECPPLPNCSVPAAGGDHAERL